MGRRSVIKERFSKKYRHPTLDSKITLKRLNAVSVFFFALRLPSTLSSIVSMNQCVAYCLCLL